MKIVFEGTPQTIYVYMEDVYLITIDTHKRMITVKNLDMGDSCSFDMDDYNNQEIFQPLFNEEYQTFICSLIGVHID